MWRVVKEEGAWAGEVSEEKWTGRDSVNPRLPFWTKEPLPLPKTLEGKKALTV
jgi:hypothetical protein